MAVEISIACALLVTLLVICGYRRRKQVHKTVKAVVRVAAATSSGTSTATEVDKETKAQAATSETVPLIPPRAAADAV